MRISDWSSDVCSSDLKIAEETELSARAAEVAEKLAHEIDDTRRKVDENLAAATAAAAADRTSVVAGKSVSVRVDLGGSRFITKKNNQHIPARNNRQDSESTQSRISRFGLTVKT